MNFIDIFRKENINITRSREAIFEVIENSNDHLTIEEIFEQARKIDSKIGLATVYRTINLMCELSLVDKHNFKDNEVRYEKNIQDSNHHHHIIDIESGDILEFFDDDIDKAIKKISKKYGFDMKDHVIEIYAKKNK